MSEWMQKLVCPDCEQHSVYYVKRDEFWCAACEQDLSEADVFQEKYK